MTFHSSRGLKTSAGWRVKLSDDPTAQLSGSRVCLQFLGVIITLSVMSVLEVRFIGDEDALEHIVDKQEGVQSSSGAVQKMVKFKSPAGRRAREDDEHDEDENGLLDEQNYIHALGTGNAEEDEEGLSRVAGSSIFTFQKVRRGHSMAQTASELARTPAKSVTFSTAPNPEPCTPTRTGRNNRGGSRTPQRSKKVQFVSTTPHRLRKRITTPSLRSDSDSELSPSDSGEDEEDQNGTEEEKSMRKEDKENLKTPVKSSKSSSAALYKTPAKKSKTSEALNQPSMVEEYFEAHGSSKVLTSDRTLERLHTPKLDREMLVQLLEGKPSCYSKEIQQLFNKHKKHFNKWMLQLQLGFNVLVYGLGSKKCLLEDFRATHLADEIHLVVNGFFPSITLKSILNALACEVLEYEGTFRTPSDQLQYITQTLKDRPDLHVYLLIHNIDGPMLRGEKTQSALGHLASLPNLHLVASLDHINAPLVWDQFQQSQFNWLWWECVTFQHYAEETSYENSLLVQQTGALALSSLTHVLRSLTPNARGIFKLLVNFQLENKDNPSYTGLSFQDFYQRCREAFLVNSDLTLRTQLTEFRDHKLIRTRKGADGVEYLLVAVDASTLMDFLENEACD
ncbi:origin recognition complex subunit 2 [Halichoeres trimaculatus]|uniref:origin recognition complex subunit 2 n=1 Tax=Halichoeres trimaculatus TaxID=147232 RepID=UPI003D9DDBC9